MLVENYFLSITSFKIASIAFKTDAGCCVYLIIIFKLFQLCILDIEEKVDKAEKCEEAAIVIRQCQEII